MQDSVEQSATSLRTDVGSDSGNATDPHDCNGMFQVLRHSSTSWLASAICTAPITVTTWCADAVNPNAWDLEKQELCLELEGASSGPDEDLPEENNALNIFLVHSQLYV